MAINGFNYKDYLAKLQQELRNSDIAKKKATFEGKNIAIAQQAVRVEQAEKLYIPEPIAQFARVIEPKAPTITALKKELAKNGLTDKQEAKTTSYQSIAERIKQLRENGMTDNVRSR